MAAGLTFPELDVEVAEGEEIVVVGPPMTVGPSEAVVLTDCVPRQLLLSESAT